MKPKQPQIECPVSWAEMPAWANFITIDGDGEIDAWEVEPRCHANNFWATSKSKSNVIRVGDTTVDPEHVNTYIWQRAQPGGAGRNELLMENLQDYTTALRKQLPKALVRRKNLMTYARHVAPSDPNKKRVEANLAKHAIEIDVLNVHIEAMQEKLKALKAQLAEKGVNFTLAGAAPMQPKKAVYRSTGTANGKTSFTDADAAREFISDLSKKGYSFHGKPDKSPVLRDGDFHGVQWCDVPWGKLFFYTTRRDVFQCYSSDKR